MAPTPDAARRPVRTGWTSRISLLAVAGLLLLTVTGLLVTLAPFHAAIEWSLLLHTGLGLLLLAPIVWYSVAHWLDYKQFKLSDTVLLGYVAVAALLVCLASGLVVTWQGLFGVRMTPAWRTTHLWSTYLLLGTGLAHGVIVYFRARRRSPPPAATPLTVGAGAATLAGLALAAALATVYPGQRYVNEFPEDYHYLYGEDRPFAPSLAMTASGGAYGAESLAGSETCGTAGCHTQILEEWRPSAHRYAAMDPLFQKVQSVMAEQNGAESTRYCGGCHDPISLFSGTKNIFVDNLTGLQGYQEGISCLACHGVRETDLQGNANYVMTQPPTYLWQWQEEGPGKLLSDFLIRTYPDQHTSSRNGCSRRPSTARPATSSSSIRRSTASAGCSSRTSTTTGRPATGSQRATRRRPSNAASATCRWWPPRTRRAATASTTTAPRTTACTGVTGSSPPTLWCRRCSSSKATRTRYGSPRSGCAVRSRSPRSPTSGGRARQ